MEHKAETSPSEESIMSDLSGTESTSETDPEEVKMYFIYSISGFGKQYIGSTSDFNRRMREHKYNVPRQNSPLYQFIRESGGWDLFQKAIIESRYMTLAEALTVEKVYIRQFNAELNALNTNPEVNGIDMAEFHRLAKGKTGKERRAVRDKLNHEANRERRNGQTRDWKHANPEKARECTRASNEKNKSKIKEKSKEWYIANRERELQRMRDWRLANPNYVKGRNEYLKYARGLRRIKVFDDEIKPVSSGRPASADACIDAGK